jgi:hypothetical protein
MKRIYFLWATIRPEMMYETYKHWINNCITNVSIHLRVAVFTEEQKKQIESYNINNCEIIVVNDKPGYTYAVSKLTDKIEANDEDILLLISDDFYAPKGWDKYLIDKFENWDGGLFIDDGYQNPKQKEGIMLALTLTCITFSCLKKLNRIALHPDYYHFFSDNEIYQNLKALDLLKDDRDIDNMVFEHKNPAFGKRNRDNDDDRYYVYRQQDENTFYKRMSMSLEERLKF